jgi:glyoxylase-like metal-dependent hydrolase (beta-lactamase superfamily II)
LSDRVHYLPGGVNAAIVVGHGGRAILVDTGGDKGYGREIKRACEALGVTPAAILNTHAHADHYGGNDYLLRQFDVPVYAPPLEKSLMESPYLEPVYLFGGAKPPAELLNKWLLAKASRVDYALEPGVLELCGVQLEVLDTSGHAHVHYSVRVGDVLLAADAVFGASALDKYPLPFGQDIAGQIQSARRVAESGARVVLPGHGEPSEDARALADQNLRAFERAAQAVEEACRATTTAEVLQGTCHALGVTMSDLPRYTLNLCTVMAYLTYLREEGRIELVLQNNTLRWLRR